MNCIASIANLFIQLGSCLPQQRLEQYAEQLSPCGNKLPQEIHQKLYLKDKKRIVVIGDIHGCDDEFQDLLQTCEFNPIFDQLILVGDLVSKGPKSMQVLRRSRELGALMVRGNHDDSILAAHYKSQNKSQEKLELAQKLCSEDIDFLEQSPFTLSLPEMGVIIVHAGIVPGIPLHEQSLKDMYTMRNIVCKDDNCTQDQIGPVDECEEALSKGKQDGSTYAKNSQSQKSGKKTANIYAAENNTLVGSSWVNFWRGPNHIIFGHDAKRGLQLGEYYTGLDGGCCYGKKLFALVFQFQQLDEDVIKNGVRREELHAQIVSVDAREVYEVPQG